MLAFACIQNTFTCYNLSSEGYRMWAWHYKQKHGAIVCFNMSTVGVHGITTANPKALPSFAGYPLLSQPIWFRWLQWLARGQAGDDTLHILQECRKQHAHSYTNKHAKNKLVMTWSYVQPHHKPTRTQNMGGMDDKGFRQVRSKCRQMHCMHYIIFDCQQRSCVLIIVCLFHRGCVCRLSHNKGWISSQCPCTLFALEPLVVCSFGLEVWGNKLDCTITTFFSVRLSWESGRARACSMHLSMHQL